MSYNKKGSLNWEDQLCTNYERNSTYIGAYIIVKLEKYPEVNAMTIPPAQYT